MQPGKMQLGMIGLGRMGANMVQRLLNGAGHQRGALCSLFIAWQRRIH